jgi:hypothetical protein
MPRSPSQVAAYGACVQAALPAVDKGKCETEFAALRTCFFAAVRASSCLHTWRMGVCEPSADVAGVCAQVKDARRGK